MDKIKADVSATASVQRKTFGDLSAAFENYWTVKCLRLDENGERYVAWEYETVPNLVVNQGLTHILESYFRTAFTPAWYCGLIGATTGNYAAGDTLASHSGWTEFTDYDTATRRTLTFGAAATQAITATGVLFTISGLGAAATLQGALLCTTNTGTNGTLYGVVDWSSGGDRTVNNTDIVTVTVSATAASA